MKETDLTDTCLINYKESELKERIFYPYCHDVISYIKRLGIIYNRSKREEKETEKLRS